MQLHKLCLFKKLRKTKLCWAGKHEGPWCLSSHGWCTETQGVIVIFRKDHFDPFHLVGKKRQIAPYGDLIQLPLQSCMEMLCFLPRLVYCSLILFKPQRVLRITELHWYVVKLKIQAVRRGNVSAIGFHYKISLWRALNAKTCREDSARWPSFRVDLILFFLSPTLTDNYCWALIENRSDFIQSFQIYKKIWTRIDSCWNQIMLTGQDLERLE